MPTFAHEGLLALIRNRPEFAAELLREVLHVEVPEFTEARVTEAAFNELVPTEYTADLVVLLVADKPVFGIVHEAQLQPDERKRYTWPHYATSARAQYECPVVVVVITIDEATARWAAKPIPIGGRSVFAPEVIGPSGVPVVTEPERAMRNRELAVLSVMAHGRDEESVAVAIARAAAAGIEGLQRDQWVLYSALIESSLSDAARKAFAMLPQGQQFFSETQRKSFEQGRLQSRAEAVVEFLEARGFAVTEEQRERILGCTDLAQLRAWTRKVATISETDELFAE
jgi:hypothetical protein